MTTITLEVPDDHCLCCSGVGRCVLFAEAFSPEEMANRNAFWILLNKLYPGAIGYTVDLPSFKVSDTEWIG